MLPIVDKPLIQYAVEEAVAAGITDMIFVTGRNKRAIEDHFDKAYELETELQAHGKNKLLKEVRGAPARGRDAASTCARPRRSGLGHAVLCARHLVGDEPFAVILADDLIDAQVPVHEADGAGARASAAAACIARAERAARRTRRPTASSRSTKVRASAVDASPASSRSPSPRTRRRRSAWSAATS